MYGLDKNFKITLFKTSRTYICYPSWLLKFTRWPRHISEIRNSTSNYDIRHFFNIRHLKYWIRLLRINIKRDKLPSVSFYSSIDMFFASLCSHILLEFQVLWRQPHVVSMSCFMFMLPRCLCYHLNLQQSLFLYLLIVYNVILLSRFFLILYVFSLIQIYLLVC